MPMTEQQANALRQARLPIFGWVDEGNGRFTTPEHGSFNSQSSFTAEGYSRFAELTRSRWDLVTFLKTSVAQWRSRG